MPWRHFWGLEKGTHLPARPRGFKTPSLNKALAMIKPSAQISGMDPKSRAATCEKSRGASKSQINSGIGIFDYRAYTPIQVFKVQPQQKCDGGGGIP